MWRRWTYAVVAIALVAAVVAYVLMIGKPDTPPMGVSVAGTEAVPAAAAVSAASFASGPLAPPRGAPAGYREYRSEAYRFSLFYPENLTVREYDEGGGASTIVFQNIDAARGFQIFIVPYAETTVSEERFRKDAPSGVRKDPKNVVIDGAVGTSFFSHSPMLGDTAEVWFISGGYLFEVTAPKLDAVWLSDIIQTWKFI